MFPVFRIKRLTELLRAVVHQRSQYDIFSHTDVVFGQFAEFLSEAFVDFPVGFALPQWLYGLAKRMDKWVHIRGVEVVFFVPGGSRQYDVAVQAGG